MQTNEIIILKRLESLKAALAKIQSNHGKDGKDGKDGLNGADGKDGRDGIDGKDGQDGKDGNPGRDGVDGSDGKDGNDGTNGRDGKDGIDGRDGKDGLNGKDGVDGKDGQDGADGVSINDIKTINRALLEISLSNGSKKRIELPRVGGGGGAGGGGKYTNETPVPNTVGGISSGTTFSDVLITDVLDMLLYPFAVSLSVSPSTAEFGSTVVNPVLSYTSKDGATQSINRGVGDVLASPVTTSETVTDTATWTMTAALGSLSRSASATLQFLNRVYWGVTTAAVSPDAVEIIAASNQLSNSKSRSLTYDCSGGRRYWIAYPARLGAMSNIRVNNLPNNSFDSRTISFTNSFGYTEDYMVYTSLNAVFGASVPVQWA